MKNLFAFLLAALAVNQTCRAAEPEIDFNRDIRPILSNNCYACHGPDDKVRKAKLRLDTHDGAIGKDGVGAVVLGKPEESELLKRVTSKDSDKLMPPPKTGKKLSAKEAELLSAWIKQGAKYATHWSYTKPVRTPVPKPANAEWARNAIDNFILDRLQKEGLKPSAAADKPTLIRRVALDLTGLPPTVKEVEEFLSDKSENAYEKMVDRYLKKPAFGEHWARMWLDLARYADSAGYADDPPRVIWAFRDYVIKSFNKNKPFDKFTIEQIAGDMLPDPSEEQRVATAFHRNTMTNSEGGTNDEEFRNVAVVDRVNTTLAVWMGTSMACAQCHTHKYDPISQKEYFRFFAFLNNTADADRNDEAPVMRLLSEEQKKQIALWDEEWSKLDAQLSKPMPEVLAKLAAWEAALPKVVKWQTPKPRFMSWSDLEATVNDDGTILVSKAAKTDTYTVELPITGNKLTALRLEALPHESLPSKGPGFGGGNFVINKITAAIQPPKGAGPKARFVRVELLGKNRHLSLAEVQAFVGKENVALKGEAKQISTAFEGDAKRAIDGNTNGDYYKANSVTHTKDEDNPWWEVDLKAEAALDKLVIWNRTDGNNGAKLTNFKILVLDEKRKPIWEKTVQEAPKPSTSFTLNGTREIKLAQAVADYSQEGFDAGFVLNNPQPKTKGWAIGGEQGQKHTLTLIPDETVSVPEGSRLIVTIEQTTNQANHLLGHFRVGYSTDAGAADRAVLPEAVDAILQVEAAKRTPEQKKKLDTYYLSVAPELKAVRTRFAEVKSLLDNIKPSTTVPVMVELNEKQRRTTKIQFRGNFLDLGDAVTEGVPSAFHAMPKDAPMNRLGMAQWLVSPENPLTARVTVNRFWAEIFGTGLVRTTEEFGTQGELPSHPELLDWMAVEFQSGETPWDIQRMLKLMVMSATYRQISRTTPELQEKDPDNRFYARGARHRLSAEMIRDQALAVSGLLSSKMHGPSVRPARPSAGLSAAFGGGLDWLPSAGEDRLRRGIYTEWRRTSPYPSMVTFDAPSREACTLRRSRTNTPLQALVTLNDPVYVEASQALGRVMASGGKTAEEKAAAGFRAALARTPTEKELAKVVKLYNDAKELYGKDSRKAIEMATNPIGPLPKDANATELAAWAVVGNVLLNLDEFLMRR